MTSAVYGRMRLGTCVKQNMGKVGCKTDVLSQADGMCSGRQSCTIGAPHPLFDQFKPCLKLKTYLETSYVCQKGELIARHITKADRDIFMDLACSKFEISLIGVRNI